MITFLAVLFSILLGYFVSIAIVRKVYWKRKNVPGPIQYPVVGAMVEMVWKGQARFDQEYTKKFGRWFGYFDGPRPVLLTSDLNAVRAIMVKDFDHFVNRNEFTFEGELLEKSVSALKDQRWKDVRSVLVPTFTSGKLRLMNPLIIGCNQTLLRTLDKIARTGEVLEVKKLFACVTMDILASTFFGTKIDAQNNPKSDFVKFAQKGFENPFTLKVFIAYLFPIFKPLLQKLGVQFFPKDVERFFVKHAEQMIKMRLESNQERKDFLQLMLNSLNDTDQPGRKAGPKTHEEGETEIIADYASMTREHVEHNVHHRLTSEELIAQSVVSLVAGYETMATALSFLSHSLAVNQDVQDKLRQEIEDVVGDREPTYDLVAQMEYLDCCINESLRMYPPIARLDRVCNENWEFNGLKVEKGTMVAVPIYTVHHDPEYWDEPERFIPERFAKENRGKVKPYSFLTFGQGPRNCMGMRFAYFEMKMVAVSVLKNFRIVPTAKTEVPLQLKDAGFISPKNGVWIAVEKVSS